jgi:B12 binding domain/Radical SAM superfamily
VRVLFVEHIQVTLAIEALSAYLTREGHRVDVFFDPALFADSLAPIPALAELFNHRRPLVDHVKRFAPGLVCFSVVTEHFQWALGMARAIKAACDVPIVFGGIHPTAVPVDVLAYPEVDYVVVGEGEGALADLAHALETGGPVDGIANLGFRAEGAVRVNPMRPLITDLDSLPWPDKDLLVHVWRPLYGNRYHTTASRGCPHRCSYCCHSFLAPAYRGKGPYHRVRSVANVIAELVEAKRRYNPRSILIHDNALIVDRKWFAAFAEAYAAEVNIPYFCWVSPDSINEETVALLKKSNCTNAWIGVTRSPGSAGDPGRRARFDGSVARALDLLRAANIYVVADNVYGLPGQTAGDIRDLIRLYIDHPVDLTIAFFLRYYPKIALIDTALAAGAITPEQVRNIERHGLTGTFILPDIVTDDTARRLSNLMQFASYLPRRVTQWLLADDRRLRLVPRRPLWIVQVLFADAYARLRFGKRRIPLIAGLVRTASSYTAFALRRVFYRFK